MPMRLSEDERKELVRLAKQLFGRGLTVSEVADKLCVGESLVREIRREYIRQYPWGTD